MNADDNVRNYLELQPIFPLSEWWHFGIFVVCIGLLFTFAVWMIRRDSRSLPSPLTWLLSGLRLLAIACLIAYVLSPGQRSESRVLTDSRLAVLVDTSLSMGLRDQPGSLPADQASGGRRIDEVISWIESNDELSSFRKSHDLSVYRFGDSGQPEPIVSLPKLASKRTESSTALSVDEKQSLAAGRLGLASKTVAVVTIVLLVVWSLVAFRGSNRSTVAGWLAVWVASFMVTLFLIGLADLAQPKTTVLMTLGLQSIPETSDATANSNSDSKESSSSDPSAAEGAAETAEQDEADIKNVDWDTKLLPVGTSTSIGSAIQFIVNKERGGPLAGIVVFTDGQSNSGVPLTVAASAAANANIPVFPVGIGDIRKLKNIQVADVQAPPRVFPDDRFRIKSVIKAFGLAGRSINIKIVSVDEQETEAEQLEAETTLTLGDDGEAIPFEFEVNSGNEGKRKFIVRTEPIVGEIDATDNQRSVSVEVMQRQTKVLLIAGGPNREFRFLRNQLYRDDDILLHVWLQSAKQGADQESDELLDDFPVTESELFFYDCVIAFDPDWRTLAQSQTELLERWVAEKAGGLVVVAGPVNTPEWTRRPRGDESIDLVRQLYPVSFFSQGTAQLKLGRFGGSEAFPLAFSREGRASRFLWLGDSAIDSSQTWGRFDGVFGYYAVNESKPGADVLASFADPDTAIDGELPIYLASQFYGSGRVFFQASAEMWRVRDIDVTYFQDYYTQLIRWVSQGRLLRDSNRGVLLTDRDQCWMGDQVNVQAILRDAADEPLMVDSVSATLTRPDGTTQLMNLKASGGAVRPGTFEAQFATTLEGEYRIQLPVPESETLDVLTSSVRAAIPDLEKAKPQRNDAGLAELADRTQGHYYIGADSFESEADNPMSPAELIVPQDQETFLTGTLDRFFKRKLMIWLLVWIVVSLAMEWTIRRLHKLS
ncbi:MAG: VWA domain-containing protein [Planctomycetota bacterium]